MKILGVDTGGTFTDFVLYHDGEITVHKVLSTPHAPEEAILKGIQALQLDLQQLKIIHGSTVATNAVLEGKGARTVFVTNHGLKDLLLIGRQARKSLYDLQPPAVQSIVERELCLETGGRLSASGEVVEPLSEQALTDLVTQIKLLKPRSVAINLIFSFLNPRFEKMIEDALPSSIYSSLSTEILPEYKEYERGMTTWLNAYVGPLVQDYLQRLGQNVSPANVSVMQSSGGTASVSQSGKKAVNMLLSGPAGGLQAAKFIGEQTGCQQLLTFDMGGTSTDVALVDGDVRLSGEAKIADLPVAVPMVDMHTIGAGGGSIARIDEGDVLQVGPESAGASPGPACYGLGGIEPTVTDANVVLGRLPCDRNLAGSLKIEKERAYQAIQSLAKRMACSVEQAADGIIRIANEHMAQALRVISVQKGFDPRDFALMSFGGAGGLHVCYLAELMAMSKAIVPLNAGVLSAFGMLVAPVSRELSLSRISKFSWTSDQEVNSYFDELMSRGKSEMESEDANWANVQASYSLDLRYVGQSYYLNVPWIDKQKSEEAFHQVHSKRYGHKLAEEIELVNVRLSLKVPSTSLNWKRGLEPVANEPIAKVEIYGENIHVPVWNRMALESGQQLKGPVLIVENIGTTYIKSGWSCIVDEFSHLILHMTGES